MPRPRTVLMALVLLASALAIACRRAPREGPPAASRAAGPRGPRPLRDVTYERTPARVARGRYLTEGVLQCFLCHSDRDWSQPGAPPIAGRKGAGHVWEDRPWLVSPNLTPDRETGAGAWTDDMLARAIREGIGHDGRVLHPQMWYASFRSLSDEDLASVIVYLRTLEPVRNLLPRTTLPKNRPPLQAPPPLEAEVRWPNPADPVTRGAYLVRVADCTGCHTAFEAPKTPGFFGGGNLISFDRAAPVFSANITPDASGIGYYDAALFREVLRTGRVRARTLSSAMPWIVFRNMTDADLDAIFAYLRARRPVAHDVSNTDPPTACPVCGQTHGLGDRNRPPVLHEVRVDSRVLADYAGEYRFNDGLTLDISAAGGRLQLRFGGEGPAVPLVAISPAEFTAPGIPDVIRFVRDAGGRVTSLLDNTDEVGEKVR